MQSLRVVEKLENGEGLNLTKEVRDGIVNHKMNGRPSTLEGAVVSLSDRIAYVNHDIDDAIRAGIIVQSDLPQSCIDVLGGSHGARINTMILDVLEHSFMKPGIRMSERVGEALDGLRDYMFEKVYLNPAAKSEEGKTMRLLEELYGYYLKHLDRIPHEFSKNREADGDERVVADYIACMTDRYALLEYERIFVPKSWM